MINFVVEPGRKEPNDFTGKSLECNIGVEMTYKVRSIKLKSVHTLTFKRI